MVVVRMRDAGVDVDRDPSYTMASEECLYTVLCAEYGGQVCRLESRCRWYYRHNIVPSETRTGPATDCLSNGEETD